ncbi:TonB-dependent receptor plug domain-containing protein [Flavitalea sp.]|nr:TonB-dependent receptor plug domain-containing protein [Flavitalea sp.]
MLSVEELLEIEVSLVSRSPQKLASAPSSVQVISGDDIRHSGASNLAEALRLVSNLQVAQQRSNAWIIGSRGFNAPFSNKLLVMIDGRTVYTPLFAGVFWDIQNVLLEDVEKIEVVSGPGGALWGANAVNGLINVVTKKTSATQGLYASVQAGTFVKDQASLRWGGKLGKKVTYKLYGQHYDRNSTKNPDGSDFQDEWRNTQGGFKIDWEGNKSDNYTVQGDYYGGTVKTGDNYSDFNGQNVLARWRREISDSSDLMFQIYYDRYYKSDAPGMTSDEIKTIDLDFQYRFPLAKRHTISTGAGYRRVKDEFISTNAFIAILPSTKNLDLLTAFIQDEISLSQSLKLSLGTKLINNVYTGMEWQPGIRFAWSINNKNSMWASVTRAVRTPSRVDVDYFSPAVPQPPTAFSIVGGPNFRSEKVLAYELGHRLVSGSRSTFSIATFYNVYSDVYSLEPKSGTLTYEVKNGSEARAWGCEFSGSYQLLDTWKLRGGYSYFDIKLKSLSSQALDPSHLSNDVNNQVMLQSITQLPAGLHLDVIARYLDYLPATLATSTVPGYFTFDARLAYTMKFLELAVVGQNLYSKDHTEFDELNIPRSVYAKLTLRL